MIARLPAVAAATLLAAAGASAEPAGLRSPQALAPAPAIRVPAGFRAEVYATGLKGPTAMAWSPRGRLYVTQEGGDVVSVAAGSRRPRLEVGGFRSPLGLTWHGGSLYVSAQGTLWRVSGGRKRAIVRNLPFGLHQQDNVVPGPDGRLYFGSGSTCDACRERSRYSAAILSVRPDGRDLRVVATGLRNPFGLAFDPETSRLYATDNGRDEVRNPAETLVYVQPGRFYGWPRCWADAARRRLVGSCAGVEPPLAFLEQHSSADGLTVYRGQSFPPTYQGNVFVALWGQYLSRAHGRRVDRVVVHSSGDFRRARVTPFARGFEHPLAVAVDGGGALLVADHGRGVVYRIQADGHP